MSEGNWTKESYCLAVTGSIASGKTHTCALFNKIAARLKIPLTVVNVDLLRAEFLEDTSSSQGQEVQIRLIEYFGNEIVSPTGGVNRRRLADITFFDEEAMRYLDHTLDPPLIEAIKSKIQKASGLILVEWALITEKELLSVTNYNILLISCSRETQLRRLSGGDLPEAQILERITSQYSTAKKRREITVAQKRAQKGDFYELNTNRNPGISAYKDLFLKIVNRGGLHHEQEHRCRA